jgi:hypothetical protein
MASAKPTQQFVPIKEIRDGVAVLKDGQLRMVLMASSLNFALKSEDEQNAIISQYQSFLNSLDFSVQFFIQSRKINITPYISSLKELEDKQTNELLKIQTTEYIDFIKDLVKNTNVVEKLFYIIIPYSPKAFKTEKGAFGGLKDLFMGSKTKEQKDVRFEEAKLQLQQRIAVIQQGLARTGVRVVPLDTEELIELFYKLFNPGETEKTQNL